MSANTVLMSTRPKTRPLFPVNLRNLTSVRFWVRLQWHMATLDPFELNSAKIFLLLPWAWWAFSASGFLVPCLFEKKNSWNRIKLTFFWRVSTFWNHCATSRPPTTTPPPPPPRPPPCTASPSSSTYMEQNFSYCDQENLVVRRTLSCTTLHCTM